MYFYTSKSFYLYFKINLSSYIQNNKERDDYYTKTYQKYQLAAFMKQNKLIKITPNLDKYTQKIIK
jgi:hypothetical protein